MKKTLVLVLAMLLFIGTVTFFEGVAPGAAVAEASQVLERGSQGADVKSLQEKLNALGFSTGYVDGIFGPRTEKALKEFQAGYGLAQTGVVNSLAELNAILKIGTSEGANILHNTDNPQLGGSDYENGVWREASGGSGLREIVTIEDTPVEGVNNGIHIVGKADDSAYTEVGIDNVPVKFGAVYMFSVYAKGSGNIVLEYGKCPWQIQRFDLADTWQKYTLLLTIGNEDGITEEAPATSIFVGVPKGVDSEVFICDISLIEQ